MKGIVFTELLNMTEATFGYEMVDKMIVESKVESGGAYASVGTYPHAELVALVVQLHKETGVPIEQLLNKFGHHMLGVFTKNYRQFFDKAANVFDFFISIDKYIHVEVLKLYPEAELPRFQTELLNPMTLQMDYFSHRGMHDFAEGLIEATLSYYKQTGTIQKILIDPQGTTVRFIIVLAA